MDNNEHFIRKTLSDVPPLPDSVFPGVEAQLRRRARIIKNIWAISIIFILGTGLTLYSVRPGRLIAPVSNTVDSKPQAVSIKDINEELRTASDFINGNTIENDLQEYAFVEPENY